MKDEKEECGHVSERGEKTNPWFSSLSFIRKPSGFTLIEIIIVLIIIGIASGLVGVYIGGGSGKLALRTFTNEVSAVLRYARSHAASEKKSYFFEIDKNEGKYSLYSRKAKDEEAVIVINKSIPEELNVIVEDSEMENYKIEFTPRGNSSGGSIEIRNEKGTGYVLAVNRITGKVEVLTAE